MNQMQIDRSTGCYRTAVSGVDFLSTHL